MSGHLLSKSRKTGDSSIIDLNEFLWYWEDASKEIVANAMKNKRDGTFAIRQASTPGDFTLTLRVNETNKLIKILVRGKRCGFTMDSLDFDNIVELVKYYRKRTLKQFNDQLNVGLTYPLCKPHTSKCFGVASRIEKLGEEIVKCRLEGLQAEYERISRHYDKFVEQHTALMNATREKHAALKAYKNAKALFLRNIDVLKRSADSQTDAHRASFHSNIEIQNQRVADLAKAQKLTINSLHNIEQTILCLGEEIANTQPRLAAIRVKRDECRDILAQRNFSQIERFLKEVNYILDVELPKLSTLFLHQTHNDWVWEPQWWLVADPTKERSNHLIEVAISNVPSDRPANGIFLIRPSLSRMGYFVLVITMSGGKNCIINNILLMLSIINRCWRIWFMVTTDKRLRAAAIAYLIPAISIAILESLAWTASVVPLNLFSLLSHNIWTVDNGLSAIFSCILRLLGLLLLAYITAEPAQYKYSLQAFLLGVITGFTIAQLASFGTSLLTKTFSIYLYVMSNFHFSEFFVTGLTNLESLKPDSFLLNHSKSYWTAVVTSWLEFLLRAIFFPNFNFYWITFMGVLFCVVGEVLRKLAMCHACVGFTHQIAIRRKKNHTLITNGVYAICRHPGYLGWWLWSIGTQLIICNPVCALAYAYVTYDFFKHRIYDEERYLIEFFGQRYIAYQQRVPTGIPGIRGFNSISRR